MNLKYFLFLILIKSNLLTIGQTPSFQIALAKYNGGGDWYANPTALPNLIKFCNENMNANIQENPAQVDIGNNEIFNYPFIHLTGHGNVVFDQSEIANLRKYLTSGGFLHISDNYGLDQFIRNEMLKVFPELEFVVLPYNHPIYSIHYEFKDGLPKIHEHNNENPQGLGLIYEGRLICFYDFECDLGDGWEDQEVHNDSNDNRTKALKMGANIIKLAFTNQESF
jgi:hypothetical protein